MPDTRQRKLAWKMWLDSCLVVIFFWCHGVSND